MCFPTLVSVNVFLGENYTVCRSVNCMGEAMKNSQFCIVHNMNPQSVKAIKSRQEEAFYKISIDNDGDACFELWKH